MISVGELLYGTDEDFLVNLYLAALGRWPDEAGLAHHGALITGAPDRRLELISVFTESEEGRRLGSVIRPDAGPVPAEQALAAQLRLRTRVLRRAIEELHEAPAMTGLGPAVSDEIAALGATIASLGVELRERMAAMEATLAGRVPVAPQLSPAISLDYVNDLVEVGLAQVNLRIRQMERRLVQQDEPPPG
jgi:hypothetical protein